MQHSTITDGLYRRDRYQLKEMYIRMFVRYRSRGICVFKFADGRSVLESDEEVSE